MLKRYAGLILGIFLVSGWFLVCLSFDFFIHDVKVVKDQHKAWTELEHFISDADICPHLFKSKKLGQSIINTNPLIGLRVGKEWRDSGYIIKDLYILTPEEEISWAAYKGEKNKDLVFVKVTMVEKPQDQAMTLKYMMNASEYTRILSIPAVVGEEFAFNDCRLRDAENFCHEISSIYGIKPSIKKFRAPASEGVGCGRSGGHKVMCFIPHKGGEIKSCGQNKKALASEGL